MFLNGKSGTFFYKKITQKKLGTYSNIFVGATFKEKGELSKRAISGIMLTLLLTCMLYTILNVRLVACWSNGGYSDDPSNPDYGTHDWIAEHALDWLPEEEKRYIVDNLAAYLYGTELPDNGIAPDGIGDTAKHHIYYWSNESL